MPPAVAGGAAERLYWLRGGRTLLIGVLSDVHGNLAALEAVLAHAGEVAEWWCLGDIVGYGPEPARCLAIIRERCAVTIAGNHDAGVAGELPATHFNEVAWRAIEWTQGQLTAEESAELAALARIAEVPPFTLVHGSPAHPLDEYILSAEQVVDALDLVETPHLLVGHSHLQCLWATELGFVPADVDAGGAGPWLSLAAGRLLVNPGSVGQPRDRDPRAAYLLINPETQQFQFRRVAYDVAETQRAIRAAGLPDILAERLGYGM